ncbi:6094_t:CDS:1, partial [Cetraspora pellucida]
MTKNLKNEPMIQLPNSDNTESRSFTKCKRIEELYKHLSEIETADSII